MAQGAPCSISRSQHQTLWARTFGLALRVGFHVVTLARPFFSAVIFLPLDRLGATFLAPPIRLFFWTFAHAAFLRPTIGRDYSLVALPHEPGWRLRGGTAVSRRCSVIDIVSGNGMRMISSLIRYCRTCFSI